MNHPLIIMRLSSRMSILAFGMQDQEYLRAGLPKVKPLENTTSGSYYKDKDKVGSKKEETQPSLVVG